MSDDPTPERTTLTTSDHVSLDALVQRSGAAPPRAVAAIAHPHPQFGGDMHNNVVAALARGLAAAGASTVRYDFRPGAGSAPAVARTDHGAALDAAHALAPRAPVISCGYSFGADVALTCTHPALALWLVVAPPLRLFADDEWLAALDARPVHIIAGVHDQFAAPATVRAATAGWRAVTVHEVEMADHFFGASTARVAELVSEILASVLG